MPQHVVTHRPPRAAEIGRIADGGSSEVSGNLGCAVLLFGIVPGLGLAVVGHALAPTGRGWLGALVGAVLGGAILGAVLNSFAPTLGRLKHRAKLDAQAGIVEEITVSGARVVELSPCKDEDPVLVFDIGEGRVLLLLGQWLRDADTYGAPLVDGDPNQETCNGLGAPWAFPSDSFTVTRLPHSGHVFGIRVTGPYLPPASPVAGLRPHEWARSELFPGSLEEVVARLSATAAPAPLSPP
jgi:hypothetical protein